MLISALSRPLTAPSEEVLTSAFPRPLPVPADFAYDTMQRPADCVDNRNNVYTHSVEPLLAYLPLSPPPPVNRQSVPLSPVCTQATANLYENTDLIPSLSAHRYVDSQLYVNTTPYSSALLSQPVAPGQSNIADVPNLYAASYASNLRSSSMGAFHPAVCTSYADHIQPQPIAVD